MTRPIETAFKHRLQALARERTISSTELWQNVVHERFLARLCTSSYHKNFILKGGILLSKFVELGRETRDIDFSIKQLSSNTTTITQVIQEIIMIDLNDGFSFHSIKTEVLEHSHMDYPGVRIKMYASLGKSKIPLFIDLGCGDIVQPVLQTFELIKNRKGPFFEKQLTIQCYPLEFSFAEKLETIFFRKEENSRMKDYHDLLTLIRSPETLNYKDTIHAIKAVFAHRRTTLSLPIQFGDNAIKKLQAQWTRYQNSAKISHSLPYDFRTVLDHLNDWLTPVK